MAFGISAGAAALIGGGVAAAGSIIGGMAGADAAENAANTQAAAADRAAELQYKQFQEQQKSQAPFREAGLSAQNRLLSLLGLSPTKPTALKKDATEEEKKAYDDQLALYNTITKSPVFNKYTKDFGMGDFQQDPGYGFRMSEGLKALDRTAASRGGLLSGSTLKGAQRFGQDLASQEYTNAFNRYQVNRSNQINPLQTFMGSGQSATNVLGSAGQNYANQAGEAYMGAGNARASGYIGSANALSNAFGGVSNAFTNYNLMNALNNRGTSTAGYPGGYSSGGGVNAFL